MATAKQLPSGNWRCQAYVGTTPMGQIKRKSFTASTKEEAEQLAAAYKANRKEERKQGVNPIAKMTKEAERILQTYRIFAGLADQRMYTAVLLTATTGLHTKDLCNLKWSDLDFKQNKITLERKTRYHAGAYVISVPQEVMAELYRIYIEETRRKSQSENCCKYVKMRTHDTILNMQSRKLYREYNKMQKRMLTKIRFQDLCATFAAQTTATFTERTVTKAPKQKPCANTNNVYYLTSTDFARQENKRAA